MAIRDENGYTTTTIDIGDWDMDTTVNVNVAHGLSATEWKTIRSIDIMIRDDLDSSLTPLDYDSGLYFVDSANFRLSRNTSATFNSVNYDSTSYNRGFVTFDYTPD